MVTPVPFHLQGCPSVSGRPFAKLHTLTKNAKEVEPVHRHNVPAWDAMLDTARRRDLSLPKKFF